MPLHPYNSFALISAKFFFTMAYFVEHVETMFDHRPEVFIAKFELLINLIIVIQYVKLSIKDWIIFANVFHSIFELKSAALWKVISSILNLCIIKERLFKIFCKLEDAVLAILQ